MKKQLEKLIHLSEHYCEVTRLLLDGRDGHLSVTSEAKQYMTLRDTLTDIPIASNTRITVYQDVNCRDRTGFSIEFDDIEVRFFGGEPEVTTTILSEREYSEISAEALRVLKALEKWIK